MPLTILLGILTACLGNVVTSSDTFAKVKAAVFHEDVISAFAGKPLNVIINGVLTIVNTIIDDPAKQMECKIALIDAMLKGQFDAYKVDADDRADARATDVELTKIGRKPWEIDALTIGITVIFSLFLGVASVGYLYFHNQMMYPLFSQAYSALIVAFTTVVAFWIGSNSQKPLVEALQQSQPVQSTKTYIKKANDSFNNEINSVIDEVKSRI